MNGRVLRVASLVLILAVGFALAAGWIDRRPVQAQADSQDPWSDPVNLSNSGGAGSPRMVVDPQGGIHVVWLDEQAGGIYTRFAEGAWTDPVSVKFPFDDVLPLMVVSEQYIHAFWIDSGRDNVLMHTRALLANAGANTGWEKPKSISRYVRDFDVVYQGAGVLHMAYVHFLAEADQKRPEGILYRQSKDDGGTWAAEALVYPSRYFRNLRPDESNINIAATTAGEQTLVSVAWDIPPLKRVFYARSADTGATWELAVEVDGPAAGNVSGNPYDILLAVSGQQALRLWRGNLQSGVYCTQYYQSSADGGQTWSERETMLQSLTGCPQDSHLLTNPDGSILLQTMIKDQVYLVAWDGEKWSDPQLQGRLSGFDNPATNDPVIFRCLQPVLSGGQLVVAGCDESPAGDVWITSRQIGPVADWFPPPSRWEPPINVLTSAEEVFAVDALRDAEGRLHILWTQFDPPENEGELPTRRSFYYASWDGGKMTVPVQVLRSPDNFADSFSLTYDAVRNRLGVAWNGGKSGELYYSWADVGRATSSLEWAKPVTVPALHSLVSAPQLRVGRDGINYLAYSLPINEDRGVYLVTSQDGGDTWTPPAAVFAAGNTTWQAVGAPQLALTEDSGVHLAWSQGSVVGAFGQTGVYYTHSNDGGKAWPEAQLAFNDPISGLWLETSAQEGLHRFWLAFDGPTLSVYQDSSTDGGQSWSLPGSLSSFGESPRAVRPYVEPDGRVALVQIASDPIGRLALGNYEMVEGSWRQEDTQTLPEIAADRLYSLAASAGENGTLGVVYAARRISSGLADEPWQIVFMNRREAGALAPTPTRGAPTLAPLPAGTQSAETPPVLLTLPSLETPAPPAETAPAVTAAQLAAGEVTAEPTSTPLRNLEGEPPSALSGQTVGMALAAGAALLVAAAFFTAARLRRRR